MRPLKFDYIKRLSMISIYKVTTRNNSRSCREMFLRFLLLLQDQSIMQYQLEELNF